MGSIWGRQDPGGPYVGSMNFAIWELLLWATAEFIQMYYTLHPFGAVMNIHVGELSRHQLR